jgi:hypothetical protein
MVIRYAADGSRRRVKSASSRSVERRRWLRKLRIIEVAFEGEVHVAIQKTAP